MSIYVAVAIVVALVLFITMVYLVVPPRRERKRRHSDSADTTESVFDWATSDRDSGMDFTD